MSWTADDQDGKELQLAKIEPIFSSAFRVFWTHKFCLKLIMFLLPSIIYWGSSVIYVICNNVYKYKKNRGNNGEEA